MRVVGTDGARILVNPHEAAPTLRALTLVVSPGEADVWDEDDVYVEVYVELERDQVRALHAELGAWLERGP